MRFARALPLNPLPMKTHSSVSTRTQLSQLVRGASILFVFSLGRAAFGQSASLAPTAARPSASATNEAIVLSPFEVTGDPRDSYEALNTSSIVGVTRELARLPITADIFTEQAMRDLGVTSVNELLNNYVAGIGAAQTMGPTVGEGQISGGGIGGSFSMRGVALGEARRDALLGGTATALLDTYNQSRVEIIRGPQSLIYGAGSPAGVVNVRTKQANFGGRSVELTGQTDDSGTARGTVDINYGASLAGRPFAFRLNGVSMRKRYWREILSTDTEGAALAVAVRPFDRLLVRAEIEQTQRVDVMLGRQLPLVDRSSPYNGMRLPVILADGNAGNILNGKLTWQNVNSLLGEIGGNNRRLRAGSVSADFTLNSWLSAQVKHGRYMMPVSSGVAASFSLVAPTEPANPTKKWAVATNMQFLMINETSDATRASLAANFKVGRLTKGQLVVGAEQVTRDSNLWYNRFYRVDSSGNFIANPALVTNLDNGRTFMPVTYIPVEEGLNGLWNTHTREITDASGNVYRLGAMGRYNVVPVTDVNPFGATPLNFTITEVRSKGAFATLFNSWLGDRLDTMLGYRAEEYDQRFVQTGGQRVDKPETGNIGAVYHLISGLSLYAGYSDSFSPPNAVRRDYKNDVLPAGRGVGAEAGVKFNLLGNRLTGSLGAYRIDQKGQVGNAATTVVQLTDPEGINGRLANSTAFSYSFDNRAQGYELTLTAQPTKNTRIRFGFVHSDGKVASDVKIPLKYNDQFNTNAAGQVTYSDGSLLLVRATPSNPASALIPLTVAMMRDRLSPYFANLDPSNGRIINAATLGLTGTSPSGATIGTGKVGLPISAHQLGFVPPGGNEALVVLGGEKTTGYPVDSISFSGSYAIADGTLRGVGLGLNVTGLFNQRAYYYNTATTRARTMLEWKDQVLFSPFLSFQRKLSRRFGWSVQLTVNNVFDSTGIRRYPDLNTGTTQWAAYSNDPRSWSLTSTLKF